MSTTRSHYFMHEAFKLANISLELGEIPVGCVIVNTNDNDSIIATGHNHTNITRNGTKHAEMMAIDEIIQKKLPISIFQYCEVFVTCEPCIMCAAALGRLGIKKVSFGCNNERFGGNGSVLSIQNLNTFQDIKPYEIESGIMAKEAIDIFQLFYTSENRRGKIAIPFSSMLKLYLNQYTSYFI